ncbi:hypothetical protein HOD75_03365 [archaeon]|nr:hypothetical protein [archaeon]MBT4241912.1 hypothetical protein [archaeon]MBT4418459.1 hypothetical protein [archaeon]
MSQLTDVVRIELYNEFYAEHADLFKGNLREYCSQCKRYVEDNFRERYRIRRRESKSGRKNEGD